MKLRLYAVAAGFGLFALAFDLLALGAAGQSHPAVAAQARAESPLAHTYVVLGRHLVGERGGLREVGDSLAEAAFGNAWEAVEAQPDVALDTLYAAARGKAATVARLAYWGAPVLLVLFVPLFIFRERKVQLIRNAGR